MKSLLNRVWKEDEGVLTFEWILLITVLVIGIVGGLSAVRDAIITELGDVAEAMISLDQSYTILPPWEIFLADCEQDGASDSQYIDGATFGEARSQPEVTQGTEASQGVGVCPGDDQGNF